MIQFGGTRLPSLRDRCPIRSISRRRVPRCHIPDVKAWSPVCQSSCVDDCWLQESERELDGRWWVAAVHQLAVLHSRHTAVPRHRSVRPPHSRTATYYILARELEIANELLMSVDGIWRHKLIELFRKTRCRVTEEYLVISNLPPVVFVQL